MADGRSGDRHSPSAGIGGTIRTGAGMEEHMTMRRLVSLAIFSVALSLAACATGPARYTPPAAEQVHPPWLVGTWQGTAYQVVASRDAAQEVEVTVTFE